MIVVDSSALVCILFREFDSSRSNTIIGHADAALVSAVSLLETSMVLAGRSGSDPRWSRLDEMVHGLALVIVPFDTEQAMVARTAFLRYGKGRHPAALNMGDCTSYALAKSRNLPLLFKGGDFSRTDLTPAA